jgi:hypothetical protein
VFEEQQLHLDLFLPGNKRVVRSVTLYGPVDPTTSSFRILSTKVRSAFFAPPVRSFRHIAFSISSSPRFARSFPHRSTSYSRNPPRRHGPSSNCPHRAQNCLRAMR